MTAISVAFLLVRLQVTKYRSFRGTGATSHGYSCPRGRSCSTLAGLGLWLLVYVHSRTSQLLAQQQSVS
jgi:hypothetical protein